MKEMITAIGGCLLILVMIIEIVAAENTFSKMTSIGQEVANFKEVVRQDGCVTSANAKNIKERIGKILKISEKDVRVWGTDKPLPRGSLINYNLEVPIKNTIGAKKFWGIEDDGFIYKLHRQTASEYIEQ